MKKILLSMAAVAMVCSCANDLDVATTPVSSNKAITFEAPVVNPSTRANGGYALDDTKLNKGTAIRVWAKWTENDFSAWSETGNKDYMTNVLCTWNANQQDDIDYDGETGAKTKDDWTGTWLPEITYFWPKNGMLTFAAVASYQQGEDDAPDAPTVAWATPAEDGTGFAATYNNANPIAIDGTQPDLLYSELATNKTSKWDATSGWNLNADGSDRSYEGVQLNFKHALSWVVFTHQLTNRAASFTDVKVKVTGIQLKGIYNEGTFSQGLNGSPKTTSNPAWTTADGATTVDFEELVQTGHEVDTVTTTKTLFTEEQLKNMFLMPQQITDKMDLVIKYKIEPVDVNKDYQDFENVVTFNLMNLKDTTSPTPNDITKFEPGKKYIFNLVFDLDNIYFSPEVTNWVEVQTADIMNEDMPAPEATQ